MNTESINPIIANNKTMTLDKNSDNRNNGDKAVYGIFYGENFGQISLFKYIKFDKKYKDEGASEIVELDLLSRLEHPHIIQASNIFTPKTHSINGIAIIMPLGDIMFKDLIKNGNMTTKQMLPILYKLACAIDFLHKNKILHLNINASNVILQGMHPYLINFRSAIFVDDLIEGKKSTFPLNLPYMQTQSSESRYIRNSNVDIWDFANMFLYAITGNELKTFALDDLDAMLIYVSPIYRSKCKNLLKKILNSLQNTNANECISAKDIYCDPLFDDFRDTKLENSGFTQNVTMTHEYAGDHRDIVKLIYHWCITYFGDNNIELLFLSIDLFNRVGAFYNSKTSQDRINLATGCLWIACKLLNIKCNMQKYLDDVRQIVPEVTIDGLLDAELDIIYLLNGILNVNTFYHQCNNKSELLTGFSDIIMNQDSTVYAKLNISDWLTSLRASSNDTNIGTKAIAIQDAFA
jgi:serine/threonine protein kinase